MIRLSVSSIPSPLGTLWFAARGGALCALYFGEDRTALSARLERRFGAVSWEEGDPLGVAARLEAYLGGALTALDALTLDAGGTPFESRVWAELRRIPAGATRSYGDVAREIGAPTAVRAVGAANGRNPIAIVVPCHRVIGKSGTLTGYAGGLARKQWLLVHEAAIAPAAPARERFTA